MSGYQKDLENYLYREKQSDHSLKFQRKRR